MSAAPVDAAQLDAFAERGRRRAAAAAELERRMLADRARRRRRTDRALGPGASPGSSAVDAEETLARADLAALLRQITRSRAQAERVLELLGEALEIAHLDAADQRLHLGIQTDERCVHVTVVQRYVAWAFGGSRRGFGLILDDATVRARAIARARMGRELQGRKRERGSPHAEGDPRAPRRGAAR